MAKRTNYYKNLRADYSKPGLVSNQLAVKLLNDAQRYISFREEVLPEITSEYNLSQIEQENQDWWPSHCEIWRQGRMDILAAEYTGEFVYFCADGPFKGRTAVITREAHWCAITA